MICQICLQEFKQLSYFHLKKHGISPQEYKDKFKCVNLVDDDIKSKISVATSGENNPMFGTDRSGKNAPNYGIHLSEEWKNKISKTRIEKGIAKGSNNPRFGKHCSQTTITKMSNNVIDRMNNGLFYPKKSDFKKGFFHSNKLNKDIWHDSSYERKALELFEQDDNIVDFRRNNQKFVYIFEGIQRNTLPDFCCTYKNGNRKIIEIKPQRILNRVEIERVKVFFVSNYCKDHNIDFEVWTEINLGI